MNSNDIKIIIFTIGVVIATITAMVITNNVKWIWFIFFSLLGAIW